MKSIYWKVAIVALLLVAIAGVLQIKQRQGATSTQDVQTPVSTVEKTPAVKSTANLPRMLELGSDSCRPCQMMQPVLEELRKDYAGKLQVDFIDVWKDEAAGKEYGVQSIPTQIFFDANGEEIFRHIGYYSKEDILAKFNSFNISF